MAEYLSPGVYVEEFDSGIKPMEGVSTSTAGFVGMTERGKLVGVPEFVGSYSEFQRKFGGYLPKETYGDRRFLPMAVEQFFANGGSRCFVTRLLGDEGAEKAKLALGNITLSATSEGAWGNNVVLECMASPVDKEKLCNIQISVLGSSDKPVQQEAYQNVSVEPSSDDYIGKLLEKSLLVDIEIGEGDISPLLEVFASEDKRADGVKDADRPLIRLAGGADCKDGAKPFEGVNADVLKGKDGGAGQRSGLNAFRDIPEISIIIAPGVVEPSEIQAVVTHCEIMENRVCILDMPSDVNNVTELQKFRIDNVNSSYAAMYHPWIQVFDPLEKKPSYMPPSGAMAGIYARTDNTRGVHKAPANEGIRGCTGLQILFGKPEQDMLNPVGVNLIRSIQGQSIRVWGARTCSGDASWKYINVRRLFIFIEETIRRNTAWAVFEPNDQILWTKVRGTISSFLGTLWRDGALAGGGEGDSYFVNIGKGSTMTDDDILNGRLICVIGVAPVRPAEFVIFRITQIMETNS